MKKTFFCLLLFFTCFTAMLHAGDTAPEEYVIEKQDTLWDISGNRLEDAFLWPKLWSVNPHIENPDLIYPGTKIIIPTREELLRMTAPPLRPVPAAREKSVKKPERKTVWKYTPVMKKKFIIDKRLYISSGWIADRFPGIGTVTHSPKSQQMSSKNDIVYIKLKEKGSEGGRFFIIRNIKTVRHPESGKKVGHQVRVVGILEITGTDDNMTRAKIVESYEAVQIGDGLIAYHEMEAPRIPDSARAPDINGYIIESHINSYLIGEGDIIFLDKGEKDGIQVGDVFRVISGPPARRAIGKIQIVSLKPKTSGAVLLQSDQEITIGDRWGQVTN